MAIKLTQEEIKNRMENLYNGEYELISEYINNQSGGTLLHKKCGTKFSLARLTRFFNQSNSSPCPNCRTNSSGPRLDLESYKKKVEEKYPNQFRVLSFTKMHDKSLFICNKCNKEFEVTANTLFLSNRFSGCPNCRVNKRGMHTHDNDYLKNSLIEASDGDEYEWLEKYKGNPKVKHKIKHLLCNNEFEVQPTLFRYGDKTRCPFCARKRSKTEKELADEISKYVPIITSDRSQINPYELDIYIPSKKVAIEYNGLHWHSEKIKGRNYHKDKLNLCNSKGIRLIQIFEDEWEEKREIVLSKIKNIIGIKSSKVIYARKCICKKVEFKEYSIFLEKNHIQGSTVASLSYGLFYENELVAVGCFNHLRSSMNKNKNENAWDMIRYASDINTSVIGGCGKIILEFVKNENCKYLKTLADLRWSDKCKNMYTKLDFRVSGYVEPRYFYTDGHKRYPRFSFRKDRIKEKFPEIYDPKLTEFEMMDKTYYERIWDAGKITYEKFF